MAQLIKDEQLKASEKEIEEEIKTQADSSGQKYEEFKELIERNHYTSHIESDVKNKKLIDFLLKNNTIVKGKKVDYIDLMENKL